MKISRKSFLNLVGAAALAGGMGSAAQAQQVTLSLHQFLPAQANVPKLVLDVWPTVSKPQAMGGSKLIATRQCNLVGARPN